MYVYKSCNYCHYLSLALKPADLYKVLVNVFEQAQQLKKATESACASFSRAPNVTVSSLNAYGVYLPLNCPLHMSQVFLDELNASTCGGLFKEVIIDKSFEGEVIVKCRQAMFVS